MVVEVKSLCFKDVLDLCVSTLYTLQTTEMYRSFSNDYLWSRDLHYKRKFTQLLSNYADSHHIYYNIMMLITKTNTIVCLHIIYIYSLALLFYF